MKTDRVQLTIVQGEKNRFRLTIAYDGRPYDGWQSQPGGNTIQDHLQAALRQICPAISGVQGSGRTDGGVSATAQIAHFDVPADWRMNPPAWQRALNSRLPPGIRIMLCDQVDPAFHARFNAIGKIYRYRIFVGDVLPPLEHGLSWHRRALPLDSFVEAIQIFVGTHFFRAFSANRHDGNDQTRDTVRTIFQINPSFPEPEIISLDIHGSGFLYKMVRFMIGTGFYLATGKIESQQVVKWLSSPAENTKAPFCAPPDGLSLIKVCYE